MTQVSISASMESIRRRLNQGVITYATAVDEIHRNHGSIDTDVVNKILSFTQPNMATNPPRIKGLSSVVYKKPSKTQGNKIEDLEDAITDLKNHHRGFCLSRGSMIILKVEIRGESALTVSEVIEGQRDYNTKYFNMRKDPQWEYSLRNILKNYRNITVHEWC